MSNINPSKAVTLSSYGPVMLITIDHAPVNALAHCVRDGLLKAVEAADNDDTVQSILIVGAGRHFIGGSDIREFGKFRSPPSVPEVCDRIEACGKPVVAAIHGAALGGGLEVALAAHYRIATDGAQFGFPEVLLGLIPGAGGTQRAPRLLGAAKALDLMLSGRRVGAEEALELGLVDRISRSDDVLIEGLDFALELVISQAPIRRSRDASGLSKTREAKVAVASAHAKIASTSNGLISPFKIIEAVDAGICNGFEDGLKVERALFFECIDSPQRAALIHAFFAEREVTKVPHLKSPFPRPIQHVGVVGGGTMGAGIAVAILNAGLSVTMVERDAVSLERGLTNVESVYNDLIAKGRMTSEAKSTVMARWAGSTNFHALADTDLVIEAVYEDLAVKHGVFSELDRVCKPGAILATNTSYLDISEIASKTSRPHDVVGLHFFSPANVMKLIEVVAHSGTGDDVIASALAFAKQLKKVPVLAGICDGFIGNRMLRAYKTAADHMMEDGASPYQIDKAVRDFGYPMGPYQVSDLAGGDISWASRKRRASLHDQQARYVRIPDLLCERGWFGQKTGRGFYLYPAGSKVGLPDPEVETLIEIERARAGVTPRRFTDQEIVRRYLAAMINEGANLLNERIAARPLDIDVALMLGYGFPRFRGGPMHYADSVGLGNILADIYEFSLEDPHFWSASPLLVDLVKRGANFSSLNQHEN